MMEMKSIIVSLSLVVSLLSVSSLAQENENLIINGDFEDTVVNNGNGGWQWYRSRDVSGWQGDNIEIWDNFGNIGAYEGAKHAELNAHPSDGTSFSIYQTFNTTVGQSYNLFFAYGARSNNRESFKVEVAGQKFKMDDHEVNQWSTFSETFVAQSDQTTLRFTSVNPKSATVGNFLDAIRVTAVPEPDAPMTTSCHDLNAKVDRVRNYVDVDYNIKTHNYCGSVLTSCNKEPSDLTEGINDVRCKTVDSCGSTSHCDFTVTVPSSAVGYNRCDYEGGAPLITQRVVKALMWPPTHVMGDVGLKTSVADCDSELTTSLTTEVWSNEPEIGAVETNEGTGSDSGFPTVECGGEVEPGSSSDNDTSDVGYSGKCGVITREDAEAAHEARMAGRDASVETDPYGGGLSYGPDISSTSSGLSLRLERESDGAGRVYMIITRSTDSLGDSHQACTPVIVPKEMTFESVLPIFWQAVADKVACDKSGEAPAGYHRIGD